MILFRIKFINGSVDNKKRDLELQQAIYSITFRFFHYSTCFFFLVIYYLIVCVWSSATIENVQKSCILHTHDKQNFTDFFFN